MSNWNVDASHSTVGFTVRHLVISKVRGRFAQFSGTVTLPDSGALEGGSVKAEVQIGSIDTAEPKRDGHLKSPDFFDAENFPRMTVRIDEVALTADGAGVARGRITILGETRPLEFPVSVSSASSDIAQVTASLEIDRSAFGMTWRPMKMASLIVAIDVHLRFVKTAP